MRLKQKHKCITYEQRLNIYILSKVWTERLTCGARCSFLFRSRRTWLWSSWFVSLPSSISRLFVLVFNCTFELKFLSISIQAWLYVSLWILKRWFLNSSPHGFVHTFFTALFFFLPRFDRCLEHPSHEAFKLNLRVQQSSLSDISIFISSMTKARWVEMKEVLLYENNNASNDDQSSSHHLLKLDVWWIISIRFIQSYKNETYSWWDKHFSSFNNIFSRHYNTTTICWEWVNPMSSRPKFCDLAGSIFLSHNMLEDQTLSHFESIYSKNKWYSILVYRRRTPYVQHANLVGCIISPRTILTLDTTIRRAARVIRTSKQLWIIMSCDSLKWKEFVHPFTWW